MSQFSNYAFSTIPEVMVMYNGPLPCSSVSMKENQYTSAQTFPFPLQIFSCAIQPANSLLLSQ